MLTTPNSKTHRAPTSVSIVRSFKQNVPPGLDTILFPATGGLKIKTSDVSIK